METLTLIETAVLGGQVDQQAGLVRDVKVVGLQSRNGRRYQRQALQEATQLYEGAPVYVDHGTGARSYRDRIGRLERVRLAEDGLRADLRINPKHELAEQLFWDAQHAPENVGLSHHVEARVRRDEDGTLIVEQIARVRSVDLVAEPATTASLFEGTDTQDPPAATQDPLEPTGRSADVNQLPDDAFAVVLPGGRKDSTGRTTPRRLRRWPLRSADQVRAALRGIPQDEALSPEQKEAALRRARAAARRFKIPLPQQENQQMLDQLTLQELKESRPDLVQAVLEEARHQDKLQELQEENKTLKERLARLELKEQVLQELKEAGLDPGNEQQVSEVFLETLLAQPEAEKRKQLIQDRKTLVEQTRKQTPVSRPAGQAPENNSTFEQRVAAWR